MSEKIVQLNEEIIRCQLKELERVHTNESIIIANNKNPAKTASSLSYRVKARLNRLILRKKRSTSFHRL